MSESRAHMDHLGMGGSGSLERTGRPAIHHGADDNASGAAGVMALARWFSARGDRPKRSLVFMCFSGEELGTLGSSYFVAHATPQPIDSLYAMLNLDMVGRLRNARLLALGAATARELLTLLDSLNTPPRFDLRAAFRQLSRAVGKAIVFAREDLVAGDTSGWLSRGDVRDVPHPGDRIRTGHPICTVFADGRDSKECEAGLVTAATRIYEQTRAWEQRIA